MFTHAAFRHIPGGDIQHWRARRWGRGDRQNRGRWWRRGGLKQREGQLRTTWKKIQIQYFTLHIKYDQHGTDTAILPRISLLWLQIFKRTLKHQPDDGPCNWASRDDIHSKFRWKTWRCSDILPYKVHQQLNYSQSLPRLWRDQWKIIDDLHGYVSNQFWSTENHRKMHEESLYPHKNTVWWDV